MFSFENFDPTVTQLLMNQPMTQIEINLLQSKIEQLKPHMLEKLTPELAGALVFIARLLITLEHRENCIISVDSPIT